MRSLRTLGVAAAALLVSTTLAGTAAAKDGFYVAPSLGWIIPDSISAGSGASAVKLDSDNGWAFYGAAGYRFGQFRVEGELGYGEINGAELTIGGQAFDVDAEQSLFTGTVAGYVDFATASAFTPYVGAGLGFINSDVELSGNNGAALNGSDTEFMAFGEAGFGYAVSDTVSIVPSYRYMWVNDGGDGIDDSTAHVLRVGMRYAF